VLVNLECYFSDGTKQPYQFALGVPPPPLRLKLCDLKRSTFARLPGMAGEVGLFNIRPTGPFVMGYISPPLSFPKSRKSRCEARLPEGAGGRSNSLRTAGWN